MTFKQLAKGRPVGPEGSLGYLMIQAAWAASQNALVSRLTDQGNEREHS